MKYQFEKVGQKYSYSCIEELRVDVLETLEYIMDFVNYDGWISIVASNETARKLFDGFLKSEFNGVAITVHEDCTLDEITEGLDNEIVLLNVDSEGKLFAAEYKAYTDECSLVYIDSNLENSLAIAHHYLDTDGVAHVLKFEIEN